MDTRRLLRSTGALLAAVALLASGCGSDDPDNEGRSTASASPSGDASRERRDAEPLEPLPTEIPADLQRYYQQKLSWRDCDVSGFQCATLKAPLDYEHPDPADDLELAVTRKRAAGPGERIGSLLVNPGGPGGSAVDYVQGFAGIGYPEPVLARYDVVGMDPRGVARSEPIECLTDRQMDEHTQIDETPDDQHEVEAAIAAEKEFGNGCAQRAGDLLGHVSTIEAARDMDVLRAVLGDEKLHYVGASYGTFLGATYAGLYPTRAGRLVLDGAMDPSLNATELNRDQTAGFETAFTAFAEDCVQQSDCPLGRKSAADAGKRLSAFFERLDRTPVETGESRKLGESLATVGVIAAMYHEDSWPQLRTALDEAMKGDGSMLLQMADSYYEREPTGEYGNIMYANTAVNCLDLPPSFDGPEAVRKALPSFEKASPVFGRSFAWAALGCAYWPENATGKPRVIEAKGADPILVVGTTRDPATPYVWAQGLADQLSSAVLLTYDGDGHTAYQRGSSCIDSTINDYLVDGSTPKDGKTCS